jgi:prepilin-type processing-associated H-X9-DG protein
VIAFVCEEQDGINDGILVVFPPSDGWCDMPGHRHAGGSPFSFVDGHVENWKWHSVPLDRQNDLARVQAAIPEP